MLTTALGAVLNIALNTLLIPKFSANGAAIATFISYFAVYAIRAVDIKWRNRDINLCSVRVLINSGIMLFQVVLMLLEPPYWIVYQLICLIVIVLFNFKMLIKMVNKIIKK